MVVLSLHFPQNQVWSSQDAMQILGRAHRQPQKKTVKAIHILADGSSDLLLNAIALRKRDMFDAFVSKEAGQGNMHDFATSVKPFVNMLNRTT